MKLRELNPKEKRRTYHYPDGTLVNIQNVTHFAATETMDRLRADGVLHIIKRDWRRIEIVVEDFIV